MRDSFDPPHELAGCAAVLIAIMIGLAMLGTVGAMIVVFH